MTLLFFAEFQLEKTVTLQGVAASKFPEICVDRSGNVYYRDFDEHAVFKLNGDGKHLFSFGRPGEGPGEIQLPFRLLLTDDETKLLILSITGKASLFDAANGSILKEFQLRANQVIPYSKDTVLAVGGAPGGNYLHQFSLQGEKLASWWPTPALDFSKPTTGNYCSAVSGGKVYFTEGTYPEIQVIDKKKVTAWKLKLPKHYREPPEKAIRKAIRFDRVKVQEYYESFSQVHSILPMGETRIAICWSLHQPFKASVDVYRIAFPKGLANPVLETSDFPLPGLMVDASKDRIYVLEEAETPDGYDILHKLHTYRIQD